VNETTVTTPNELEIRVERIFDAQGAKRGFARVDALLQKIAA
jgi:hypothetical protein